MTKTLADRVRNFSRIKLKKATIKVPKLRIRKNKVTKLKKDEVPTSSIINILIKTAVEKAKREKKEKAVEEESSYKLLKDDKEPIFNGGYGTVSKGYGTVSHSSYIDYGKIFNYLGKFKSQGMYENMAEHVGALNKSTESGSFTLIEKETMEKGARYVRYMIPQTVDFINLASTSLVPMAGMSSSEWEQFKLWMKLDPVMYRLKTSTS